MEGLFGKTFRLLSSLLDFYDARHQVILSNIVNIDTPRYRPKEVVFEKELAKITEAKGITLQRTNERHLSVGEEKGGNMRIIEGADHVDIDKEMVSLAENNLRYNLTVELLVRKFRSLNNLLKESR